MLLDLQLSKIFSYFAVHLASQLADSFAVIEAFEFGDIPSASLASYTMKSCSASPYLCLIANLLSPLPCSRFQALEVSGPFGV